MLDRGQARRPAARSDRASAGTRARATGAARRAARPPRPRASRRRGRSPAPGRTRRRRRPRTAPRAPRRSGRGANRRLADADCAARVCTESPARARRPRARSRPTAGHGPSGRRDERLRRARRRTSPSSGSRGTCRRSRRPGTRPSGPRRSGRTTSPGACGPGRSAGATRRPPGSGRRRCPRSRRVGRRRRTSIGRSIGLPAMTASNCVGLDREERRARRAPGASTNGTAGDRVARGDRPDARDRRRVDPRRERAAVAVLDPVVGPDLAPRIVDLAAIDGHPDDRGEGADRHGQHQDQERQVGGRRVAADRPQPEHGDEVAPARGEPAESPGPGTGRAGS